MSPNPRIVHRDLSWLQFNHRVLMEANANQNPLLERIKFLGITSSNLDEFFMIRFPSLGNQPDIRDKILKESKIFHKKQYQSFLQLSKLVSRESISFVRDRKSILQKAEKIFSEFLAPELEPVAEDAWKALQRIENHRVCFLFSTGVLYLYPLKKPGIFLQGNEKEGFEVFFGDDLVHVFLERLQPKLGRLCRIRFSRDADVRVDIESEDPESIPDIVRRRVRSRDQGRFTRVLTIDGPRDFDQKISQILRIPHEQIFPIKHSLFLSSLFDLTGDISSRCSKCSNLLYPPIKSYIPKDLKNTSSILETLQSRDYVLHHPYDSFEAFVNFVKAAIADPEVKAIHQTIYRVDSLSEVIELLKQAAKEKKIYLYIEPRARFDELNNVQLAEDLRKSGVQVIFPFGEWKIHAKITLVERQGNRFYTHLSTGNYNSKTARIYTDFGILSSDPEIGKDARLFFDCLRKAEVPQDLGTLLVAPTQLHRRLQSLIKSEIRSAHKGEPARIFAKVNALVDQKTVEALYEASQAGVKVDLVVRGACSLVPKQKGLSENIRVLSIVDRYLEHSRIYYFQSSNQLYLSSADWMPRNFFSRMEIAFPVRDPRIFEYFIEDVIPTYLKDNVKAKELDSDALWKPVSAKNSQAHRSQFIFEEMAKDSYRNTALSRI